MKVPDITEEERAELYTALRERKENLEKLEKKTQEASIPIDRFEERLALYRDRDEFVKAEGGHTEKQTRPGLLAIFAPTPELSTEALQNQNRKVDGAPDLFGGGAETGGGIKPGGKTKWKKQRQPGEPEHIGDIIETEPITPPAPKPPLQLVDKTSPSNNSDVIDPSGPKVPDEGEIERLRTAILLGEDSRERDELAASAAGARATGRQIDDVRADTRDVKMSGSDDA